jgi:hypothetical protein
MAHVKLLFFKEIMLSSFRDIFYGVSQDMQSKGKKHLWTCPAIETIITSSSYQSRLK